MSLKHKIHEHCRGIIAGKLAALQDRLQDLAASAANETKSSAGDKYETSRAMLHIEQDVVRKQLAELMAQQAVLNAIDPEKSGPLATSGSLLMTDNAAYFLAIALGKMQVDGQEVIVLSVQSPLGSRLKGVRTGARIAMNGQELLINAVC